MKLEEHKEQLRIAATTIISGTHFHGEAHYLRRRLGQEYGIYLSPNCLRQWMQELADQGHFVRSKYPHGGYGFTWSLPQKQA